MKKINSTSRVIQKGNIRYWGRGIEAEDICHLKWQLDELQTEQGKEGKNMQGKKMRRGELKEYRADFFRSVGLIYAFTPSLAYKHPWNEEPVLLSLLYSPASTALGKSAWQQHLRAAVGLSRRWFSSWEVNHVGCLVPCPLPEGCGGGSSSALSSGSHSNPCSAERNPLQKLESTTVCPTVLSSTQYPHHDLPYPKNQAPFPECRWENTGSVGGNSSSQVIFLSTSLHLGNTRSSLRSTGVVSTGVSGHWVSWFCFCPNIRV